MDLQGFANPDSKLRPAPFWAINSKIEPGETARQMADMIRVGLSGGFFHSRAGLVTEYLGDEWFAAMNAALGAAAANDGYLWLYDEDLWPSGNAGGQVAAIKDEYRAATLDAFLIAAGEPLPELSPDQALRCVYAIKARDGLQLREYDAISLDKLGDYNGFERLALIRTYSPKIGWWGGESYSNLLNPEAMREFVKMTHDVYFAKLGAEFGKRIPGIFTDEPQIPQGPTSLAWYEGLPDRYREWQGRDLWADFPYLFFEGLESRKIRQLVYRTVLRQFVEAYSKPLYEWCEEHGIEHTGHYMMEDNFEVQIGSHCGGVMAHYRYQHAPGIDHLCRQIDAHLLTCKQVSSAARQLGRSRVLTEIFGVSRHTNTFEEFKWLGDYDLVLGANFLVPHLTWYSATGRRKRDYPPVWNYQQTYWDDLKPLNDYFTRVAHALTRGKAAVGILLLHSIESATAGGGLGVQVAGAIEGRSRRVPVDVPTHDVSAARYYDGQMRRALEAILNAGCDCDLGDEGYIEDLGSVRGDSFVIGEMSYKLVVVPPSTTWRPKTFELLKQFVSNGGRAIVLGKLPTELDCEDAKDKWVEFVSHENVLSLPCSAREIQHGVDVLAPKTFTLKGADGRAVHLTYVQHRMDDDQDIFFVVNSDRNNSRDYVLTLIDAKDKHVVLWDAVEGTCRALDVLEMNGDLRFEFHLPPCGSLLLTVGGEVECGAPSNRFAQANAAGGSGSSQRHVERQIQVNPERAGYGVSTSATQPATVQPVTHGFDFDRLDPNVLVMDRIAVSFDGGKTFEPEDMEYRVRRRIAERFGTKAALDWQPWVSFRKSLFEGRGGEVILRYRFESDLEKPKSFVVIEDIWKGELFANGIEVDAVNPGWHWDRNFGKVEITNHVREGENTIDFRVHYDFLTEVEPAYIVGDFGVKMTSPFRGKLVSEPDQLRLGSWNEQGYPFYSGRIVYKMNMKGKGGGRTLLRLVNPSGTLFKVRVNGEDAGRILWRPWQIDISDRLTEGVNQVEIEVVSSLQNSWGPLHEKEGDSVQWVGPNAFENEPELREEMNSFPYGLLGGIEIVTAQAPAESDRTPSPP